MNDYQGTRRFFEGIDVSGPCWSWTGRIDDDGYGRLGDHRVHRLAYEFFTGPIPRGLVIDHDCHNRDPWCGGGVTCLHRRCVTPAHLVLRTSEENTSAARDARARCPNGHLLSEAGIYVRPDDGYSKCRQCIRDAVARYRTRKLVAA